MSLFTSTTAYLKRKRSSMTKKPRKRLLKSGTLSPRTRRLNENTADTFLPSYDDVADQEDVLDWNKLKKDWESGYTANDLAVKYKLSVGTIYIQLRKWRNEGKLNRPMRKYEVWEL